MTLTMTVVSSVAVHQSADFQLTDFDHGDRLDFDSPKLVSFSYFGRDERPESHISGSIVYAGIGSKNHLETSEWLGEALASENFMQRPTFEEIGEHIRESGTRWLSDELAAGVEHTFVIAAVLRLRDGSAYPALALVSNSDHLHGASESRPLREFFLDIAEPAQPGVYCTGVVDAILASDFVLLDDAAQHDTRDPANTRKMLSEINARAAEAPGAGAAISAGCLTYSQLLDGTGGGETYRDHKRGPLLPTTVLAGFELGPGRLLEIFDQIRESDDEASRLPKDPPTS